MCVYVCARITRQRERERERERELEIRVIYMINLTKKSYNELV